MNKQVNLPKSHLYHFLPPSLNVSNAKKHRSIQKQEERRRERERGRGRRRGREKERGRERERTESLDGMWEAKVRVGKPQPSRSTLN